MPFQSKYLRFAKATSTGTQTVTGVGFQGKALITWSSLRTTTGATTGAQLCLGMTDGTLQSTRYIHHPGGEATTTSAQGERTNRIFWKTNATSGAAPTVLAEASFTAFTADGFTLNWATNDADADIIHAVVIGGDTVSASFEQVKITVASGSTISVTGVGFAPSAFIVMGGAADEFGAGDYNIGAPFGSVHGFGFSNAIDNVCGWTLGRGTGGAADAYRGQHTDRSASVRTANLSGAGELMGMQITSADADGFTLTRVAGTVAHQPVQHILCLRGVRFAMGSFATPATTGDRQVELPFEPDVVMLQTIGRSASTNAADMGLAIGAWDSTGSGGTWIGGVDAANPSVYRRAHYESSVLQSRQASSGTVDLEATVASVSETAMTLNYSTVPASANDVIYMAMAGTAQIVGSAVFGVTTTVTAPRAIAFGLDDNVNVHHEAGWFKVFGNMEVTGETRFTNFGTSLDGIVTAGGEIVIDSDGNVVYVSSS